MKVVRKTKQSEKIVLVTVGSTSFDDLSCAVLSDAVMEELERQNYTRLVLQHGRSGATLPHYNGSFNVQRVEYVPDLNQEMQNASLIISHAGTSHTFRSDRKVQEQSLKHYSWARSLSW